LNIAVVDDEEVIREQISGFIKKRNPDFNISDFATGEELLAADTEFDIIFLDIQMKGMGGIKAAKTIRQSNADRVIIFISMLVWRNWKDSLVMVFTAATGGIW